MMASARVSSARHLHWCHCSEARLLSAAGLNFFARGCMAVSKGFRNVFEGLRVIVGRGTDIGSTRDSDTLARYGYRVMHSDRSIYDSSRAPCSMVGSSRRPSAVSSNSVSELEQSSLRGFRPARHSAAASVGSRTALCSTVRGSLAFIIRSRAVARALFPAVSSSTVNAVHQPCTVSHRIVPTYSSSVHETSDESDVSLRRLVRTQCWTILVFLNRGLCNVAYR